MSRRKPEAYYSFYLAIELAEGLTPSTLGSTAGVARERTASPESRGGKEPGKNGGRSYVNGPDVRASGKAGFRPGMVCHCERDSLALPLQPYRQAAATRPFTSLVYLQQKARGFGV